MKTCFGHWSFSNENLLTSALPFASRHYNYNYVFFLIPTSDTDSQLPGTTSLDLWIDTYRVFSFGAEEVPLHFESMSHHLLAAFLFPFLFLFFLLSFYFFLFPFPKFIGDAAKSSVHSIGASKIHLSRCMSWGVRCVVAAPSSCKNLK